MLFSVITRIKFGEYIFRQSATELGILFSKLANVRMPYSDLSCNVIGFRRPWVGMPIPRHRSACFFVLDPGVAPTLRPGGVCTWRQGSPRGGSVHWRPRKQLPYVYRRYNEVRRCAPHIPRGGWCVVTSQRNEATMPTDLEPISTSSSTTCTSPPPTRTVALTLRVLLTGMSVVPTAFCWAAAVRSLYWTDGSVTWFWIEMSTFEVGYVRRVISFVRACVHHLCIDR